MKLLLALLLISASYHTINAQSEGPSSTTTTTETGTITSTVNTSGATTTPSSTPTINNAINYTQISESFIDNSPFLLSLITYGSNYIISQAADNGLIDDFTGNLSKIYGVAQHVNSSLNYSASVQLISKSGTPLHANFLLNFDPDNNERDFLSWSVEYQDTAGVPSGLNISYDADEDVYSVTQFNGFEEWLDYQAGNLEGQTTNYTEQQYLTNYIGYTAVDKSSIFSNVTIQGSLTLGLSAVGAAASANGLMAKDVSRLNVTEINSVYSQAVAKGNDFRYDVQINNRGQEGRAVYIVNCPSNSFGGTANKENGCANGALRYYWFRTLEGV